MTVYIALAVLWVVVLWQHVRLNAAHDKLDEALNLLDALDHNQTRQFRRHAKLWQRVSCMDAELPELADAYNERFEPTDLVDDNADWWKEGSQ